jgi:hypothetical protein
MLLLLQPGGELADTYLSFEGCLASLPLDRFFSGLGPEQLIYALALRR